MSDKQEQRTFDYTFTMAEQRELAIALDNRYRQMAQRITSLAATKRDAKLQRDYVVAKGNLVTLTAMVVKVTKVTPEVVVAEHTTAH